MTLRDFFELDAPDGRNLDAVPSSVGFRCSFLSLKETAKEPFRNRCFPPPFVIEVEARAALYCDTWLSSHFRD